MMMTTIIDIAAIAIMVFTTLYGWKRGFVFTVAGIAVTVASIAVAWGLASVFAPLVALFVEANLAPAMATLPLLNIVLNAAAISNAIAFAGVFVFVFILARAISEGIIRFVAGRMGIPGLKVLNKAAGVLAGLAQGVVIVLILGWALQFIEPVLPALRIEDTEVVNYLVGLGLLGWLSDALLAKL